MAIDGAGQEKYANQIHEGKELWQREKIGPDPYPVIHPLCRVESAKRG